MNELRFDRFDWDAGNDTKSLLKHGVGQKTIEAFFQTDPLVTDDTRHSGQEERFVAVGVTTEGRWLLVVFTIRVKAGQRWLRPISARYMHAKEVSRYEKIDQE